MEEFTSVTWLNCNPTYTPNTKEFDDGERIIDQFLNENCAIITKELCKKFMNANSNDDMKMVKLTMLYFVESVLLRNENINYINKTHILLVDNFNEFNEYLWEHSSFKITIKSLRKGVADCVAKHKKQSNTNWKYKGATCSVHGFPHNFLV